MGCCTGRLADIHQYNYLLSLLHQHNASLILLKFLNQRILSSVTKTSDVPALGVFSRTVWECGKDVDGAPPNAVVREWARALWVAYDNASCKCELSRVEVQRKGMSDAGSSRH
jgi:hypothetical protein